MEGSQMYHMEYENKIKQRYESIQSYLAKHFRRASNEYKTNDDAQLKDFIARLKMAKFNVIRKSKSYVVFAIYFSSHTKKKRYRIQVTINKSGNVYTINVIYDADYKRNKFLECELCNW